MLCSHGKIFKISVAFQNLRDPTCDEKPRFRWDGPTVCGVQLKKKRKRQHTTDFTHKHLDVRREISENLSRSRESLE